MATAIVKDTTVAIANVLIALNDTTNDPKIMEDLKAAVAVLNEFQSDDDPSIQDFIVDNMLDSSRFNDAAAEYLFANYKFFVGKKAITRFYRLSKNYTATSADRMVVSELIREETGENHCFHDNMEAWEYTYYTMLMKAAQMAGAFDELIILRDRLVACKNDENA